MPLDKKSEWSHEKEVLFRTYVSKYATNKLNKREKHAYEILKEQRRMHNGYDEILKNANGRMSRLKRIISGYKDLVKAVKNHKNVGNTFERFKNAVNRSKIVDNE